MRRRVRQVVGPLVLVAAAVGLVVALRAQGAAAEEALRRTEPLAVLGALGAVLVGLWCSAQVWRVLLAALGTPLPERAALHVFFLGQLGKYVPGTVFAMAAQMEVGRRYGAPRSRVATSWLLFMGVLVATGLLCGAVALPLTSPDALDRFGWVLLALPVGLVCLAPPVLSRLVGRLLRVARREPLPAPLSWRHVGAACGWALAMWGAYAVHLVLLVEPQHPEPGHRLPLLALGVFALAWAAGPFLVVAPAGAGVREAVLVLGLAPVLDTAAATAVALVSRLLMLVGDTAWAGAASLAGRGRTGSVKDEEVDKEVQEDVPPVDV